MSYTIQPGVRQDHKGRLYQIGTYPNGKSIMVPYSANGAEPARMIPLPPEPQKPQRPVLTTGVDEKRAVLSLRKRRHVLVYRYIGQGTPPGTLQFTDEPGSNVQRDRHARTTLDVRHQCDFFYAFHEWEGDNTQTPEVKS